MRLVFPSMFLVVIMLNAVPVWAKPADTCGFIDTLVGLRDELSFVRAGRGDELEFRQNLAKTRRALKTRNQIAVFSQAELRAMQIYVGAVKEDWKLNGTSSNGRQIPGLTTTTTTIQNQLSAITAKFGCLNANASNGNRMWNIGSNPVTSFVLLLALAALMAVSLGVYWLVLQRYQVKRRICHVPVRLVFGDTCLHTHILDISSGGAMVAIPTEDFSVTQLTLCMDEFELGARVAWRNSNFAGLMFDKRLSAYDVDQIADMTTAEALSKQITGAVPEGVRPAQQAAG